MKTAEIQCCPVGQCPNDIASEVAWQHKRTLQFQREIALGLIGLIFVYGLFLGGLVIWAFKNSVKAWLGW